MIYLSIVHSVTDRILTLKTEYLIKMLYLIAKISETAARNIPARVRVGGSQFRIFCVFMCAYFLDISVA